MLSQAWEIDKLRKKKEEEKFLSDSVKMGNLNTSMLLHIAPLCIASNIVWQGVSMQSRR